MNISLVFIRMPRVIKSGHSHNPVTSRMNIATASAPSHKEGESLHVARTFDADIT